MERKALRDTMFRLFLICLICGITAKPHKPLIMADEYYQDTIMSAEEQQLSWGEEVEPPQDMDGIDYDIDPNSIIWKSMTGTGQDAKELKAEEDMDDLHHPSMADLQKQDQIYQELDRYPLVAKVDVATEDRVYTKPEEDMDDLYHNDPHSEGHMEPLGREVRGETGVRVHLEPEEDMDDLYHADQLMPVPYHADADGGAPADWPSQRKYSQPEEDLDDLHHSV